MAKSPSDQPQYFNFADRMHELLNAPELKASLSRPGAKEAWINFLQSGTVAGFTEKDQQPVERVLDLINTYALLKAYEQFHTDERVNAFMEVLEKMSQGQDLQDKMAEVVAKLPEEFKEAVHKASLHAQEFILKTIQDSKL